MTRHPRPPSQTWRTFLGNHVGCLASIDFFTVPTVSFAVLFVFIVLRHERRRIVHFGVTTHPTALWVAQQLREAFPWDSAPRHVMVVHQAENELSRRIAVICGFAIPPHRGRRGARAKCDS